MTAHSRMNLLSVISLAYALSFTPVSASTSCDIHYRYGAGQNAFNLCMSNDGNLVSLESPAGFEHIAVETIGEGYAVCSGSSQVYGYDAGFDESGWGPSTVKQPTNGQTFPIIVTRTTTDGTFQLAQTFGINANEASQSPEREVTIQEKLTNLSAITINDVYLTRYVDFDIDATSADDIFSVSRDTVLAHQGVENASGAWIDAAAGHGMMLTGLNFVLARSVEINTATDWATDHTVCASGSSEPAPTNAPAGDYVGRVALHLGNLAAGASKTVNFVYRRF